MTCGICDPDMMASHYGADNRNTLVIGYVNKVPGCGITQEVARLYYLGASLVFWDEPIRDSSKRFSRAKLKRLLPGLRKGDVLMVNSVHTIGDRVSKRVAFEQKVREAGATLQIAVDPREYWDGFWSSQGRAL